MPAQGSVRVTVTFGPSRSPNYRRALEYARRHVTDLDDLGEGRYRASFDLQPNSSPAEFGRVARLVDFVSPWRMTDIEVDGEPVPDYAVSSMGACAREYRRIYGECHFYDEYRGSRIEDVQVREGFIERVRHDHIAKPLPKCQVCPLFPFIPPAVAPKFVPQDPPELPG